MHNKLQRNTLMIIIMIVTTIEHSNHTQWTNPIKIKLTLLSVPQGAWLSRAGDQVSSSAHGDPGFAGLQLPQTRPILNTGGHYRQWVSLYLWTHAHTHGLVFWMCAHVVFSCVVCVHVCVSEWMEDNGWARHETLRERRCDRSTGGGSEKGRRTSDVCVKKTNCYKTTSHTFFSLLVVWSFTWKYRCEYCLFKSKSF